MDNFDEVSGVKDWNLPNHGERSLIPIRRARS